MRYAAIVEREDGFLVATFPDCPGCVTQAGPCEDIEAMAKEALEGWLESHLESKQTPPAPSRASFKGDYVLTVPVSPVLATKIRLRMAREAAGLTQEQLAEKAGVSQPMIHKVEGPDYKPGLELIAKIAGALGLELDPAFRPAPNQAVVAKLLGYIRANLNARGSAKGVSRAEHHRQTAHTAPRSPAAKRRAPKA